MAISSSTLRRLAALELSPKAMQEVLSILADTQAEDEDRRAKQRERTRQSRLRNVTVTSPCSDGNISPPPSSFSPIPPHITTPSPLPSNTNARARETLEALSVLDDKRAKAVIEHRNKIRKPLTRHAASLLARKFSKCADPNAAADAMIANGWQGFEPEWLENRGNGNGHGPPKKTSPLMDACFDRIEKIQGRNDAKPADFFQNPRTQGRH